MLTDRQTILLNTFFGYGRLFVGTVVGLVSLPIIFNYLSSEEYGFWAIVWSLFGFMSLFDFGFGFSMQKFIPKYLVERDYTKIRYAVNTTFFLFVGSSAVILALTLFASNYLGLIFRFHGGGSDEVYRRVFVLLGAVAALSFPLNLFNEVMVGAHKMYVRDLIALTSSILSLTVIIVLVRADAGLFNLAAGIIFVNILASIAAFSAAILFVPGLRLNILYFRLGMAGEIFSFSVYTYVIALIWRIKNTAETFLVGVFSSVSIAGIYQIASKLPQYMVLFTSQMGQAISPYASKVYSEADAEKSRRLVYVATKFNVFFLIPIVCVFLFFNRTILTIWLGKVDPLTFAIVVPLLFCSFFMTVYDVSVRTLIMHGRQRMVAALLAGYVGVSMVAGAVILKAWGPREYAWFLLMVNAVFYFFIVHPRISRFCGVSFYALAKKMFLPHVLPSSVFILFMFFLSKVQSVSNIFLMVFLALLGFIVYSAIFFRFALDESERKLLPYASYLKRILSGS